MLKNIRIFLKPNCRNFVDGYGRVPIGNKTEKLVKNLQEGDEVLTPFGIDKIKSITRFYPHTGFAEMVEYNKMLITPEHPIKIHDEWHFPSDFKDVNFYNCSILYKIKLHKYNELTINGNNIKV